MSVPDVLCLGVCIVDILGRPVVSLPDGQQGARLEEIRVTVAGTAAGTAVDLARLGRSVAVAGAVGEDLLGDLLRSTLRSESVDTSAIVTVRGVQTSATILPIRPNGDRPAWHVVGANGRFTAADVHDGALSTARVVHLGGVDAMRRLLPDIATVAQRAHDAGAMVTLDLLGGAQDHSREHVTATLSHVDWLLPNAEQLRSLANDSDLVAAANWAIASGASGVAVTDGPRGALVVHRGAEPITVPALDVEVIDTTGCGDAFDAGFVSALLDGADGLEAARFGVACASIVVGGLGSDAGPITLAAARRLASPELDPLATTTVRTTP
jgi:sugar/nucleoside kinase (ribokinase family)